MLSVRHRGGKPENRDVANRIGRIPEDVADSRPDDLAVNGKPCGDGEQKQCCYRDGDDGDTKPREELPASEPDIIDKPAENRVVYRVPEFDDQDEDSDGSRRDADVAEIDEQKTELQEIEYVLAEKIESIVKSLFVRDKGR